MIIETPPAREALDESDQSREARQQLAEWILTGSGPKMDIAAAEEVKGSREWLALPGTL
jgi:hypothetical protein